MLLVSLFFTETYVVVLAGGLLMSTHNVCLCGEIRKQIFIWILLLSGALFCPVSFFKSSFVLGKSIVLK